MFYRANSLEGAFANWRRQGEFAEYGCPIQYDAAYRKVENENEGNDGDSDSDSSHPESGMMNRNAYYDFRKLKN